MRQQSVMSLAGLWLVSTLLLAPAPSWGQAQAMDEDFARAVREWTTRPEFMSPLVDHLPASTSVPSPRDALGAHVGHPDVLHYSAEILGYFRALEAKSPRVTLLTIGTTEEGKDILVAFISSEQNIRDLAAHRARLVRLGDPRGLDAVEADEELARAKPIYHIVGGVHAQETGPPEMLMELAYRLAVEESDLVRTIRERMIVALTPVVDPDGRDRVVDWYYRHQASEADYAKRPPGVPYWGKYVLHDNNRDIGATVRSSRAHLAFHLAWRPTVMHDLHESLPYLYIYSGYSVRDPGVDPGMLAEMYWFSSYQKMKMLAYRMPGVWDHGTYDIWWPGYVSAIAANHNALVQMYETFSNHGPKTMRRNIAPPARKPGSPELPWYLAPDYTARDWRRPLPAYRETTWSARNNVNYMQTGVLSALELTAANAATILKNFYQRGVSAVAEGAAKPPHAYILPIDQADLTRVAFVVDYLRRQGIEVGEATAPVVLTDGAHPAGSLVVKLNQPFGRYARVLLERQVYTGDSKKLDDTAWTLGLMTRSRIVATSDPAVLGLPVTPVERYELRGVMPGQPARYFAVLDHGSNNLATLRYRLGSARVRVVTAAFTMDDVTLPAGSLVVEGGMRAQLQPAVESLGLEAVALPALPSAPMRDVSLPRLAVYSTWGSTQDVGWVRYALDESEARYDLIYKDQVREGNLRARYDVIVVPSQGRGTARSIVEDLPLTGRALPYTRTERFQFLGGYGSSPDIRGGLGEAGLAALRTFVEQGGTLITLGLASQVPVEYGWTPGIRLDTPSPGFRAIGPIVEAVVSAPSSPLFYGHAERTMPVRWAAPLLFSIGPEARAEVALRFSGTEDALLSGEFVGIAETKDRPAVVRVPLGQGQLLLFATNPMFRHQNVGEYRLLYNAIFNHAALGTPPPVTGGPMRE